METPSSTRRVTRFQTMASFNNSNTTFSIEGNKEESEKNVLKTNGKQKNERAALIDITNDSPIVGLAMETPSSAVGKQRGGRAKTMMMTPGSGEALLRGQVKTLLQKVEEEADLSKVESRPFLGFQGCAHPPPANTPQLSNLCEDGGLGSIVISLPVVEEHLRNTCEEASLESQKSVISRSLLLDFSLSESDQGESSACKEKELTDNDEDEFDDYYEEEDLDELCEVLSKVSMEEKFIGRHTRFVYNSDDEMEREEGDAMRLKGLPTPKGKHLRFPIQEEEDDQ